MASATMGATASVVVARLEPLNGDNERLLDGLSERPELVVIKANDTQQNQEQRQYASNVILGRGPVTGIDDRSLGLNVLLVSVNDPYAIQHSFVKVTMLQDSGKAHININGRQWRGSSERESRWLRSGDTISLHNSRYEYRVNVSTYSSSSAPEVQQAAADQADARRSRQQYDIDFGILEEEVVHAAELDAFDSDVVDSMDGDGFDDIDSDAEIEFVPASAQELSSLLADADAAISVHSLSSSPSPSQSDNSSAPPELGKAIAVLANAKDDSSHAPEPQQLPLGGTASSSTESPSATTEAVVRQEASRQVSDGGADGGVSLSSSTVEKLNQDVQCAVCLDIIFRAQTLVPCGHSFCAACVKTLPRCPSCRKPSHQRVPANQLDNLITTLISIPNLLDDSDVKHYYERKEEHKKKQQELEEEEKKRRAIEATAKQPARKRMRRVRRGRPLHSSFIPPPPLHIPPFASATDASERTSRGFRSLASALGSSPPWASRSTSPTAAMMMMQNRLDGFASTSAPSSFHEMMSTMPPSAASGTSSSVRSRRGGRMSHRAPPGPSQAANGASSAPGACMANAICID